MDLSSSDFIKSPYPAYKALREENEPTWMPHQLNNGSDGIWLFSRYRDVATILREPGQQVSAVIGAANRDPERFPNAEVFDIIRTPNPHLSFGLGIHKCLGERLARIEARLAFRRLLEKFLFIELVDTEPHWQH